MEGGGRGCSVMVVGGEWRVVVVGLTQVVGEVGGGLSCEWVRWSYMWWLV